MFSYIFEILSHIFPNLFTGVIWRCRPPLIGNPSHSLSVGMNILNQMPPFLSISPHPLACSQACGWQKRVNVWRRQRSDEAVGERSVEKQEKWKFLRGGGLIAGLLTKEICSSVSSVPPSLFHPSPSRLSSCSAVPSKNQIWKCS